MTSLTEQQQEEMYRMVREMYHNFGFDKKPILLASMRDQVKNDVTKWKNKRERKTSS